MSKKTFAILLLAGTAWAAGPASLYQLKAKTLQGKPAALSTYKGKVALVVNVASKCGFTPQYKGLEKLYLDNQKKGFVILGFPSNDFGGQEPGQPAEIQQFCSTKYQVTFPLFEKVSVAGAHQSPVYAYLTAKNPPPSWNFSKYLINRKGQVVKFFPSTTAPDAPELVKAVADELAKKI